MRHWNGETNDHPTLPGVRISIFSTGVRNAYDASAGLFVPFSDVTQVTDGWIFENEAYAAKAPLLANGTSVYLLKNRFDFDAYRSDPARYKNASMPTLSASLDFEKRKRAMDALSVVGVLQSDSRTVRYAIGMFLSSFRR